MRGQYLRHRYGGMRRKSRRRRFFVLILLLVFLFWFAERKLPLVSASAQETALRRFAQVKIAETVSGYLLENPVVPEENLFTLDTYTLRKVQTELTDTLQARLSGRAVLRVPLGSLSQWTLLHGRGPKIPVVFSTEGSVTIAFESAVTSAGINRTQYRVTMVISAEVCSLSVDCPSVVTVQVVYPVYESVLEGDVPQFASVLQ